MFLIFCPEFLGFTNFIEHSDSLVEIGTLYNFTLLQDENQKQKNIVYIGNQELKVIGLQI